MESCALQVRWGARKPGWGTESTPCCWGAARASGFWTQLSPGPRATPAGERGAEVPCGRGAEDTT